MKKSAVLILGVLTTACLPTQGLKRTGPGGTLFAGFNGLQCGQDFVVPSGVIALTETVTISLQCPANHPLVIRAGQPLQSTLQNLSGNDLFHLVDSQNIEIRGLILEGDGRATGVRVLGTAAGISLKENRLRNLDQGIVVMADATGILVQRNEIDHIGLNIAGGALGNGIVFGGCKDAACTQFYSVTYSQIDRNWVHHLLGDWRTGTAGVGIAIKSTSTNNLVQHNTVDHTEGDGILVRGVDAGINVVFANLVIKSNQDAIEAERNVLIASNIVYRSGVRAATGPNLVNGIEIHPIGAGAPASTNVVIAGNTILEVLPGDGACLRLNGIAYGGVSFVNNLMDCGLANYRGGVEFVRDGVFSRGNVLTHAAQPVVTGYQLVADALVSDNQPWIVSGSAALTAGDSTLIHLSPLDFLNVVRAGLHGQMPAGAFGTEVVNYGAIDLENPGFKR